MEKYAMDLIIIYETAVKLKNFEEFVEQLFD